MKRSDEQLQRLMAYGACHRCLAPRYARLERRGDEYRQTMLCENGHYADDPWNDAYGEGWEPHPDAAKDGPLLPPGRTRRQSARSAAPPSPF